MPKTKRAPKKKTSRRPAPVSRPKGKAKRRSNPRRCNMCRGTGKLKSKRNNPCPMCKGNGYVGVQRNPGETVGEFKRRMHTTVEIRGHEEVLAPEEEEEEEEQTSNPRKLREGDAVWRNSRTRSGALLPPSVGVVKETRNGRVRVEFPEEGYGEWVAPADLRLTPEKLRKTNESAADDAAAQRAHFEKLHWGDPPTGPVKLNCPDYRDASAVLGRLVKVEYVASKGGRTYTWVHKHLAPAYLVVTKRGKLLIGEPEGKKSYIVTAAGIEG